MMRTPLPAMVVTIAVVRPRPLHRHLQGVDRAKGQGTGRLRLQGGLEMEELVVLLGRLVRPRLMVQVLAAQHLCLTAIPVPAHHRPVRRPAVL